MARPSQLSEQRKRLLPLVARAFGELGYRHTTTAELARRCGVRENILYRLWKDKRAMFIASIEYIYDLSARLWEELLGRKDSGATAAERLLEYESEHHGEFGLYRIVFAGLSEVGDPEIREALAMMYKRFFKFIGAQIESHRKAKGRKAFPEPDLAAWSIVGLGTVANIGRELRFLSSASRKRLIAEVGQALLGGME